MKLKTRVFALVAASALLTGFMANSFALMNVWSCSSADGGYYCYVSGTRG